MSRRTTSAVPLAIIFILLASASHATIWRVNLSAAGHAQDGKTWPSAFRTLQAALTSAKDGDEVWVARGVYNGGFQVSRSIALYGGFSGRETARDQRDFRRNRTILDGRHRERVLAFPFLDIVIDGFTIRNGVAPDGAGILATGDKQGQGSPRILHNLIVGNMALDQVHHGSGGGIGCIGADASKRITIYDNVIAENAGLDGGGLNLRGVSATVRNNSIVGNWGSGGGAIFLSGPNSLVVNNIVAFNGTGVYSTTSKTGVFRNNCFFSNSPYDFVGLADPTGTGGNITADPQFANRRYGDMHLQPRSPCLGRGTADGVLPGETDMDGDPRILLGKPDIGADEVGRRMRPAIPPRTVYVSTGGSDRNDGASWLRSKRTVQAGVDAVGMDGGDVYVGRGVYRERILVPPYVYLHGAQNNPARGRASAPPMERAVLDGQGLGAVVTFIGGLQAGGLDGFVVQGGLGVPPQPPNGPGCGTPLTRAAGIFCFGSSPRITDCFVTGNSTGIWLHNSAATVEGNDINSNEKNGVELTAYVHLHQVPRPVLRRNVIERNAGAGCTGPTINALMIGNAIMNNGLEGLSLGSRSPGLVVAGNTFFGNGSGIQISSRQAVVVNNIVAYNGGGITLPKPFDAVFRNNCLFRNATVGYGDLPVGSNGNIMADPKMADMYPGDPRIRPDSPCRNAGDNAYAWLPLDIDGQARILGGRVDIGADESTGLAYRRPAPRTIRVRPTGNDANDGSTWARAKRTVGAALTPLYASGGEVWVAAGVYSENVLLPSRTALLGGFAGTETSGAQRDPARHATILDGCERGPVVFQLGGGVDSLLDGFTIQGGAEYALENSTRRILLAAVSFAGSGTISRNTIAGNRGYAVHCVNGQVAIRRNLIAQNAWGGIAVDYCTASIEGNTVVSNWSVGRSGFGGIWCGQSSGTVRGNVVKGHATDMSRESSWGGAINLSETVISVLNNSVVGNSIGLIYRPGKDAPTIVNNLVAFNGTGVYRWPNVQGPDPVMRHNLVYDNGGANYVGLEDRTGVDGNLSADPKLAHPPSLEVHIQPDSPCVDAGDTAFVEPGDTDMDGQARVIGAGVDIGADESDGTVWPAVPKVLRIRPDGDDRNDGASWQSARRTIGAAAADLTRTGGEVWVAEGVYREGTVVLTGVSLRGGFAGTETEPGQRDVPAHPTVLEGDRKAPLVRTDAGVIVTVLDGFVLRGGAPGVLCNGPLTIRHNAFTDCKTAVSAFKTAVRIENNVMAANYGAAVRCEETEAAIRNNLMVGAQGRSLYGVECRGQSAPEIVNNTVVGFRGPKIDTYDPAGIYVIGATPFIANNIVAHNGFGLILNSPVPGMSRNNIWDNEISHYGGMLLENTNFEADPLFDDAAGGDYHLRPGSPCRDAGDSRAVEPGETDMDGQPRLQGITVDVGADEAG